MWCAVCTARHRNRVKPAKLSRFWVSPRFFCNLVVTLRGSGSAESGHAPAAERYESN